MIIQPFCAGNAKLDFALE